MKELFRPDIESDLEKLYKKLFDVAYYKRICEQAATQAGVQRTFGHFNTMSENDEGNLRYVICIFKSHANDTAQTNYQRCCHANVSNISVRYGGSVYPLLSQMQIGIEINILDSIKNLLKYQRV